MRPVDLAALVQDLSQVEPAQIPALLAQLSAVQVSMAARLLTVDSGTQEGPGEVLLTVEAAAARLEVSPDWLYRRTKSLPFVVRVGRHVRFSGKGLDRYI